MVAESNFGGVTLGSSEFLAFRDFLQQESGIDLGDNKQYLVATRVRRILIDYNCKNLDELTQKISRPSGRELRQKVIDVMTTNETFWFRDIYPFDYLKSHVFPELAEKRLPRLRIWSAACSSGQEPYSLSMTLEEYRRSNFGKATLDGEIVATDLSSEILDQARQGAYDQLSVSRGLSEARLREFFDKNDQFHWKVKSNVANRVSFRSLNLKENYASLGKFDIVFCRNVLIYFSVELKTDILKRIHATLKPGGLLFLGSSESLAGAASLFEMVHCNPGVMYRAK